MQQPASHWIERAGYVLEALVQVGFVSGGAIAVWALALGVAVSLWRGRLKCRSSQ